jgi:hypothetical protein
MNAQTAIDCDALLNAQTTPALMRLLCDCWHHSGDGAERRAIKTAFDNRLRELHAQALSPGACHEQR